MTSFPPAIITWSKGRGELAHSRTVVKDGELSIISAQNEDSYLYECKASNILGHDSALTNLVVLDLPRFTVNPPAKLDVGKDKNISVPCQAAGDPQPIIMWLKRTATCQLEDHKSVWMEHFKYEVLKMKIPAYIFVQPHQRNC